MTKTFELSRAEIRELYNLMTKMGSTCDRYKLKFTTDNTFGVGYHLFVKFLNQDGNVDKELNENYPKTGIDIADSTQF